MLIWRMNILHVRYRRVGWKAWVRKLCIKAELPLRAPLG